MLRTSQCGHRLVASLKSCVIRKYMYIFVCFLIYFFYLYLLALRLTSPVYMMSSWCCVDSLTTCEREERNNERGQSQKKECFMLMSADCCEEDVRLFNCSPVLQGGKRWNVAVERQVAQNANYKISKITFTKDLCTLDSCLEILLLVSSKIL